MRPDSSDQVLGRASRQHVRRRAGAPGRAPHGYGARRPPSLSTAGYLIAAGFVAAALFFLLWWMLKDSLDEAPWVPAGLAASVVMVVAVAAHEVVSRRARTHYLLEQGRRNGTIRGSLKRGSSGSSSSASRGSSVSRHAAALRALQKRCAEADAAGGTLPEAHLEAYHACQEYLSDIGEVSRAPNLATEKRVALRVGRERARALAKHHLLTWARDASRAMTYDAQRRDRVSDKIETVSRALEVIDSALRIYPEESELRESKAAVHEYIASVKIAHWVEMAERAAFKGKYARALDRYQDALFYLSRADVKDEVRRETSERIGHKVELIHGRLGAGEGGARRPTPRELEEKS